MTIKQFIIKVIIKTSRLWPAELYLKCIFKLNGGYILNLKQPQTFNEKMNWCKLHDHNPLYTKLADKYEVKAHVAKLIGEQYVVPNYGVWNRFSDIEFDKLPNKFVIKTTHDSSGTFICKDKDKTDWEKAKRRFDALLKRNSYYNLLEWPYKNIHPRIIADEYLDDGSGHELTDYKFWCFNGEPKIMYITNKGNIIKENFYSMDFQPLDINHGFERAQPEYEKPKEFELMKELAAKLSEGIPFVRIDFFDINGNVYFGEYTFFDWGGMNIFSNQEWDKKLGSWITLPFDRY